MTRVLTRTSPPQRTANSYERHATTPPRSDWPVFGLVILSLLTFLHQHVLNRAQRCTARCGCHLRCYGWRDGPLETKSETRLRRRAATTTNGSRSGPVLCFAPPVHLKIHGSRFAEIELAQREATTNGYSDSIDALIAPFERAINRSAPQA